MDPERIGAYHIERKLGSGGMGTVYLARHAETGETVALKTLSPTLAREAGFVERFNREIRSLEQLTNPHVVQLLDSGVDGETYFYAMEYVSGETLTDRLRRERRLPWREAVEIALQVCSALKAAHDAGIIHRDLKPSNLLLDEHGRVKLTDFGVAQLFAAGKLTVTGGIIGTAEYMSPEQAAGKRVTKRSDLYSLGAVLYIMLTGRPPYTGKSTLEVIQKHRYGQFDRPSRYVDRLPHWIEEIVCQLLERDPDKRFPDAYVVSRRLQEALNKFDLSQQSETLAPGEARAGADAGTVIADADLTSGRESEGGIGGIAGGGGVGGAGGTLMRDMVRAEIEHAQRQGPLERLLDNTWVLVGLLGLVILGAVLWFRNVPNDAGGPLSAARQSETAATTKAKAPLLRWLRSSDGTEADPLVARAIRQLDDGELPAARETLRAIQLLTEAADGPLAELHADVLPKSLAALRPVLPKDDDAPPALLTSALRRADRHAANKELARAAEIWNSIIVLYQDDPSAAAPVAHARRRLAETHETESPGPLP
jgi:serine/threonine-protein kinase